jgi:hypothetical protein
MIPPNHLPGVGATGPISRQGGRGAVFRAGAAVADLTPPARSAGVSDPADCGSAADALVYTGPRPFVFEEPYADTDSSGHYDPGEPYLDCNGNGRWDGNLLGGGADTPRFYGRVADPVTARALVVSNGRRTIAVEVVDQEGLFNVYQDRIRARLAADGVRLDGVFISATHDESAPDTLGLGGVTPVTSGVDAYFADHLVAQGAKAIEDALAAMRPARIRYADATEPANFRQCWSSYPFVDDQRVPSLQAVRLNGKVIATLASVSQHAETLGFNPDPEQRTWESADWPAFFRSALEQRFGGVAIEMAGSVGSVESPEVFASPISRTPQRFIDESHPAGCRTLFDATGTHVPVGYDGETRAFGEQLAGAVGDALVDHSAPSDSDAIWGARADVCLPLQNVLFQGAAAAGVFATRPSYTNHCTVEIPPAPDGSTNGTELLSQVAAFGIGDGEFISVPGEVFPFTYLRGPLGPEDEPNAGAPLPPWLMPHLHARWRFVDGLAEDMVGYIFPRGNAVGIPSASDPDPSGTDRFGCGHSDDSESASADAADLLGGALVNVLDAQGGPAETIATGRYVLPDGTLSRDPLGGPVIKCDVDTIYHPDGPAVAVWRPDTGVVHPAAWLSLDGRPQVTPDRDTRGYFRRDGSRIWLDVFPSAP